MRGLSCALGLLGMVAGPGCAASNEGLEMELSKLRREMRSLQEKVTSNELAIERLEGRMTLVALGRDAAVAPAPKTPVATTGKHAASTKVEEPKISRIAGPTKSLPVVKLTNTAAEDQYEEGALDDGSPPILIELGSGDGDRLEVDRSVLQRPDPVLHAPKESVSKKTPAEVRAAYEIARAKLRVEKRPGEARELFLRFESDFPNSRYADNIAFWLAECDLAEGRHRSAIEAYAKMMAAHPRSPKVAHALLRSAEAYRAIGNADQAAEMEKRLAAEHPNSEAARTGIAHDQGRR